MAAVHLFVVVENVPSATLRTIEVRAAAPVSDFAMEFGARLHRSVLPAWGAACAAGINHLAERFVSVARDRATAERMARSITPNARFEGAA